MSGLENGVVKHFLYVVLSADYLRISATIINENWGPYDLITPRNGKREERIVLCEGHTDTLKLRIVWDDDFSNNRSILQSPQL